MSSYFSFCQTPLHPPITFLKSSLYPFSFLNSFLSILLLHVWPLNSQFSSMCNLHAESRQLFERK